MLFNPFVLHAKTKVLKMCMDEDWFPYTFVKYGENFGIHIDIVRAAFKSLDYHLDITAKPWKRCLRELEVGDVEAIFPASYKESRADIAYYPSDVTAVEQSNWRVDQVEHVLVTRKGNPYEHDGDIYKIPQPVGIGSGSAFGDTLERKGIKVSENISKQAIIDMLLLQRIESAAMTPFQADEFNTKGEHAGKLKIHGTPLRSKSYFLIFSKKGHLTEAERMTAWDAFAIVRKDKKLMDRILNKYL